MDPLALDEVRRRLRIVGQSYLGVRAIPVARIVGSLDRNADFDREFRPRRGLSRGRLASLSTAFADGHMPPIRMFLEESGLARVRPDAVIEFSRPADALRRESLPEMYAFMRDKSRPLPRRK